MLIPALAGLGAICAMSNPLRKVRRKTAVKTYKAKYAKTGKRYAALEAAALKELVRASRGHENRKKMRKNPSGFWADAYPTTNGMLPYRFSFKAGGKRHTWIRYGKGMEATFDLAKKAAKYDYPDASGFLIESPQRDNPSRQAAKSKKSIRARYAKAHKLLDKDFYKWNAQGYTDADGRWVNTKRRKGVSYGNRTLWAKTARLATVQARTRPRSHNILAGKRRTKK
jgi:hypothetical protein